MRNLTDDAASECQHTDDEGRAHDNRDPGAEAGQIILDGDDTGSAHHGAEYGAHAAKQRH